MKVDTISTKFGDVEVEYSTFTKGFFVKKFPEKLEEIKGLKILRSRDNSFKEFSKLEGYVKDLVNDSCVDFEFSRKVIIYKIVENSSYNHSLSFEYMVCNESVKNQKYCGKENELSEYFVLDSNLEKHLGKRNIFGQLVFESKDNWVFIDYDEDIHSFIKDFSDKFTKLRVSLVDFFKKDKIKLNVLNSQSTLKMLGAE